MVEAPVGERVHIRRDLVERVKEEPLDERVEAAAAFQDVEDGVVGAVLADEAVPVREVAGPGRGAGGWRGRAFAWARRPGRGGGGRGSGRGPGRWVRRCLAAEEAVAVCEAVIDDQGVAVGCEVPRSRRRALGVMKRRPSRSSSSRAESPVAVGALELQGEGGVEGGRAGGWGPVGRGSPEPRRQHELQGRVGHAAGHRVGAVDGRDDDHAELGAGQECELGGEAVDRAAVAEPAFPEALLDRRSRARIRWPRRDRRTGAPTWPRGWRGRGGGRSRARRKRQSWRRPPACRAGT